MNNKEKSLWEMCEKEREFCHFLIFRNKAIIFFVILRISLWEKGEPN